jgi:lipoteichoic acid synthase
MELKKISGAVRQMACRNHFFAAVALFLLLNAIKIALFNFYIITDHSRGMLIYKLYMSLLLVLILYPLILRIKSRLVFIGIYIFQAFYIAVNISYYSYFHNYLNLLQSYLLFNESLATAKHFAVPFYPFQLIVLIDLPFFLIVAVYYYKIYAAGSKFRLYRMATVLTSILIIVSLEVTSYANGESLKSVIANNFLGESRIVDRYGTVVNNLTGLFLKKSEKELIKNFRYGKEIINDIEKAERPNIFMIQVESMDSTILNRKHGRQYITPFLHSLTRESIYYPYMMSYHEGGCTSDAEFSSINSIEPFPDVPAIKLVNYTYPNSMISVLQRNSYKTLAFHGNEGEFFNRNVAFPKMGFEKFIDIKAMKLQHTGWGAPDGQVVTFVENYLKDVKEPFLAYVITMSSHEPFTATNIYSPGNAYQNINNDTVRNYFNSMAYVDRALKEIIAYIKSRFNNSYIFLFGDHTPNIENEVYSQAAFLLNDRKFEFVPLFIITPDNKKYVETGKVASMLDLAPTVLRQSGVKYKIRSDGEDLLGIDGLSNKIPFKYGSYDRSYLFNILKEKYRINKN